MSIADNQPSSGLEETFFEDFHKKGFFTREKFYFVSKGIFHKKGFFTKKRYF